MCVAVVCLYLESNTVTLSSVSLEITELKFGTLGSQKANCKLSIAGHHHMLCSGCWSSALGCCCAGHQGS